jgi:hypothetical protein
MSPRPCRLFIYGLFNEGTVAQLTQVRQEVNLSQPSAATNTWKQQRAADVLIPLYFKATEQETVKANSHMPCRAHAVPR